MNGDSVNGCKKILLELKKHEDVTANSGKPGNFFYPENTIAQHLPVKGKPKKK